MGNGMEEAGVSRELYPWQEECLERWFANNGRGMVQAATGTGKTLLALEAARRLEKKLGEKLRVKVVVPTAALMRQWDRALREYLKEFSYAEAEETPGSLRGRIGLRGGGNQASPDCAYMIYVINSARYELARQILKQLRQGESVLLIADECHRYESGQNRLIFEFLPFAEAARGEFFSLGLSATLPSGEAQQYLASALGKRIYSYGIGQAFVSRTVCPADIYHIGLELQAEERAEYEELTERMTYIYGNLMKACPFLKNMGQKERFQMLERLSGSRNRKTAQMASMYIRLAYRRKSLICLASARTDCACELVSRLPDMGRIIVFGERIAQAEKLYQLLRNPYPGRVGRYHSGMQANKNAMERFRNGELRILIACKAVDEGIDIPAVSTGIILSGTSARRQRIQRMGRVIRNKEGKARASLYYLHINDTCEDTCFLPDMGETRLFELEYALESGEFRNPDYDTAARVLLKNLQRAGAGADALKEAERALRLGIVRGDWMDDGRELRERKEQAETTGERNYWICMEKLREIYGA